MVKFRTPKLAINKNSWHFRHYANLRKWWFGSVPERTSLCPYVQTIIWFSVLTVLASPLMFIGWAWPTSLMALNKYLTARKTRAATVAAAWLQRNPLFSFADFVLHNENAQQDPVGTYAASGIAFCALVFVVWIVQFGARHIHEAKPELVFHVGSSLTYLAWAIIQSAIYGLAGITIVAWAVCAGGVTVVTGVYNFFTDAAIWRMIGKIAVWTLGASAGCVAGVAAAAWFARTPFGNRILAMFSKPADYVPVKERKVQAAVIPERPPREFPRIKRIWTGVKSFFISSTVNVGTGTAKVLSPMAIILMFLWAIKKQACPLVEFVEVSSGSHQVKE